ncbi:MAG TPA: FlgD immunoglobulin-like domain containing protein [Chthonomonadaceae bacterium]|nr:FlgD immunoglobulin-like domain containing protein [Chthonomonadaceae bacterium]
MKTPSRKWPRLSEPAGPARWIRTTAGALLCAAAVAASVACCAPNAAAQAYQNISNQHFRTISNGPQSALIVDVANPADIAGARNAAHAQYAAMLKAQQSSLQQEVKFLRAHKLIRAGQNLVLANAAIIRSGGRLVLPPPSIRRAPNELTFTFPTDPSTSGAWSVTDAAALTNLVNVLYPELKAVLGNPSWNGNVTVLNLDPRLGKADEVLGALLVINGANVTIDFPTFGHDQDKFLAMAQVMAQAFHGPNRIAFDAWEIGMARTAAVIAAQDIQTYNGVSLDPANGFFYTAAYDLLNQPPLANNTFTPPTKSNQDFNLTTLSGMLVPRVEMSSTAWLKCYIENHSFFTQFNTAYYAAVAADPTVANDVTRLRGFAKAADPQVELQDFDTWFEQQYVLDSSVTPGPKLYTYIQPTFPSTSQNNDSGAAIFLIYYQTSSTGDETDLSGASQVIYWDFTFQNRLFLPSFETVTITNGFGTVAPFFVNIGGTPPDQMRVAIDFPVNKETSRVYFPAGETGTLAAPNNFSGVIVGANAGNLTVGFDNGTNINLSPTQGDFGAAGSTPTGFTRTRLVFTPTGAANALTFQRNVYMRPDSPSASGVEPIFQIVAPGPIVTLSHTFPVGPQMISLPFRPLTGDLAKVFGADPTKLLLAQYRQDLPVPPNPDKYQRYPSMPLYQPGNAFWSNFALTNSSPNLTGENLDVQQDISIPLEFGWNQIGPPYSSTNLNTGSDLFFQQLGGDVLSLSDATARGLVASGIIAFSSTTGYNDVLTTTDPTIPKNMLEPWKGYFIRVLVTEGVTLTYVNPNAPTRASKFRRSAGSGQSPDRNAWRVPITLRDSADHATGAVLGQSAIGSNGFNPALDVSLPPAFTRAATLSVRFPHTDWNDGSGTGVTDFLTDIRQSGSRATWNLSMNVPQGGQDYTISWSNTAAVPRGMRLTLVDQSTGAHRVMNSTSSYTFHAAANETARTFQVIAEPHASSLIQIMNLRAIAPLGRAVGMTVAFETTTDAEATVEIQLGGRTVRHLAQGRAVTAGVSQFVWDGKDDQGRGLPGGSYLINVTARTAEGAQTRQIIPALVTR